MRTVNSKLLNKKTQRVVKRKKRQKRSMASTYLLLMLFLLISLYPLNKKLLTYGKNWSYLTIKRIEIAGNNRIPADQIKKWSGIHEGLNILNINLGLISDMADVQPWIKSIEVRRRFPDTVLITIEESTTIALWEDGDKYYAMDKCGTLLEEYKELPADSGLYIINGLKYGQSFVGEPCPSPYWLNGLRAIEYVHKIFPEISERIARFRIASDSQIIILLKDDRCILSDINDMALKLKFLKTLMEQKPENWAFREYCDLRFKDKIIFC